MFNSFKKIAIIGAGGLSKEIACNLNHNSYKYFVHKKFIDHFRNNGMTNIEAIEDIDIDKYKVLIAIGDPKTRKLLFNELPSNTEYYTYIDKRAHILDDIIIGDGSIITAGCVLTTNITIGSFNLINLNTTIGHDSYLDNFITTSPGVHISGETKIGEVCYFGSGSVVRDKVKICPYVTIGMNGVVTKDIFQPGVYGGVPIKKLK